MATFCLLAFLWSWSAVPRVSAEPVSGPHTQAQADPAQNDDAPHFTVETYDVEGGPNVSMDVVFPILSKYTGTNVSLEEIAEAAAALQAEYRKEGHAIESVAIARDQITNGTVTLNIFQGALPQIIISGIRYCSATNGLELPAYSPPLEAFRPPVSPLVVTNAPPRAAPPAFLYPAKRATPEQIAADRQRLLQEMARLEAQENLAATHAAARVPKTATPAQIAVARRQLLEDMAKLQAQENDHRIHVVSTNAGPRFNVQHYLISGNSVLTPQTIAATITNIDGAFGANVSFDGVKTVVEQLEQAYHDRGYVTVAVTVPRQTLTNATVKLKVLEGRLASIQVLGNRYFSSNNVMASLPSLHTNMVIDAPVFNAELNRANGNQDRQIYPIIGPGPTPGTSALTLNVKDRLPLHAKIELDNQNSPGTPDLRVNGSAVYDNLWQDENALGVQYGFSPEIYKQGNQWPFYDRPSVADYSAFYRLPLGSPESIGQTVADNPTFGYDEATRQFRLPAATGQPELTIYANRATIDTGIRTPPTMEIATNFSQQTFHQDLTVNQDIGFQLSKPLPEMDGIRSLLSGGLDFKVYSLNSFETNVYSGTNYYINNGQLEKVSYTDPVPLAVTESRLDYLPVSLNYNAIFQDSMGPASFGLGLSVNLWYSGYYVDHSDLSSTNPITHTSRGATALKEIVQSTQSSGHWVILRPSFSQQFELCTNWITTFRMDGQWASEPLVSVEQFGAGGVNSVRGYHEGEVFGDTGWHIGMEQQTAPLVVGDVGNGQPLTVGASVYMDYAKVYSLDPPAGSPRSVSLWGTGVGLDASIGTHWQAQFLCSWPLLSAGTVPACQPFFDFDLTAQF